MSDAPLERCPACDCDLSARPPPNRCPDCGFEYDEHTRVWRSGETWARVAFMYTAGGLIVGALITLLYRASIENAPYPMLPLILGLLAPAVGLFFRRLVSGRITGRFVALTPGGILVGTRSQPVLVPWDDFGQLIEQRGIPKLLRRDSPVALPLDDVFADADDCAAFRTAVTQAARDRRPAGAGAGQPQQ